MIFELNGVRKKSHGRKTTSVPNDSTQIPNSPETTRSRWNPGRRQCILQEVYETEVVLEASGGDFHPGSPERIVSQIIIGAIQLISQTNLSCNRLLITAILPLLISFNI